MNQRKGENGRRNDFMINLHERMLPSLAGFEPTTFWKGPLNPNKKKKKKKKKKKMKHLELLNVFTKISQCVQMLYLKC